MTNSMSKRYRLKVNYDNLTKGTPIIQMGEGNYGGIDAQNMPILIGRRLVENTPEIFEEVVVDRIEVVDIYTYAEDDRIRVLFNRGIKHEKIKAIKQAIEFVVNYNEHPLKDSSGNNLYTQSHLEDAFNAARAVRPLPFDHKVYPTFNDYLSALKSIQPC